jgi:transcriptional regulator with XRE-family HTH domain
LSDKLVKNTDTDKKNSAFSKFLKEVMRRRKRKPSQLAADLGISHATISRWLSGNDIPNTGSCEKLADYSGIPVENVLSVVGHLSRVPDKKAAQWPEFREYVQQMYPDELDEDMITMIEDLIERRRAKKYEKKNPGLGK